MFDYQMHDRILSWLTIAADRLRKSLDGQLEIEQKTSASDLVTHMDKAIEAYLVEQIHTYYPSHRIIGEEKTTQAPKTTEGFVWLIDPIDGTLNFVKQHQNFAIMLAVYHHHQPYCAYIYDVMQHDLYYALPDEGLFLNHQPFKGLEIASLGASLINGNVEMFAHDQKMQALLQSSLGARAHGSAALEIIDVLRGQTCLYVSNGLNPWDFAAGHVIGTLSGLKVSQIDGSPLNILQKSSVIFAHEAVYEEALAILNEEK